MAYPISNVSRRVQYTGSAGVGPYSFTFEILANTDIAVYKNSTLLTLTTNYTVTINANGTGSVTLVSAATSSDTITITGTRAIQRTTDFVTGGDLFANSLNDELDSTTILIQQTDEKANRSVKTPITDPTTSDMTLPSKADRIGRVMAFHETTGNPTQGPLIADVETVATNVAHIRTVSSNIASVNTVSTNIANVNTVAGISANVTAVAGNATNINTVAANNANVTTVATNIADINTAIDNLSGIQTISADLAGTSFSYDFGTIVDAVTLPSAAPDGYLKTAYDNLTAIQNAPTNASNAASSASAAAAAQVAAEAARDATLLAYDNFDDRYLGAKASDPTLDNDGNALVAGSLYFNTTISGMKVYTGSTWVIAYVSGGSYLIIANNLSDLNNVTTARTNLGLGTMATQNSNNVNITGGIVDGGTIV